MTISIAHRGDWMHHPENTIEAFRAAVDDGADMLETDIRITRDGRAVLLHDATLHRIWGLPKKISELTWSEVCDIEQRGYRIPLLEDVLREISLPFMLDFTELEVVETLVRVLKAQPSLDRFLVVTGNVPALRRVKQLLPEVTTGLTWNEQELPNDSLIQELDVRYFNPDGRFVTLDALNHMHAKGLKFSCWTIDNPADMEFLVELGVDAIVSNQVSKLVTLIKGVETWRGR